MVLLTSSSISVAISSGVVCLFTFLLFLSGYVVQQQTVRSIQAALHQPPMPTPTLPVYFQSIRESAETEMVQNVTGTVVAAETGIQKSASTETKLPGFETIVKSDPEPRDPPNDEDQAQLEPSASTDNISEASPVLQRMAQEVIAKEIVEATEEQSTSVETAQGGRPPKLPVRLAYIQLLSNPSQICSALLFFKLQREQGNVDIDGVIIYPSSWDDNTSSDPFASALELMRLAKDEFKISYRSIRIYDTLNDPSTERELIAHLAAADWEYDRIMYLRCPGLALNFGALDAALQASQTNSGLSRNWVTRTFEPSTAPPILLISDHVVYVPRGSNRRLAAQAFAAHANHPVKEMDLESVAQTAAYVYLEVGELDQQREEHEWYGGVFERFERGRAKMCKGSSFGAHKRELRR